MSLPFKVKGGILRTISEAIYSTPIDKIREIVANSCDANADCIVITINEDTNEISVIDNGDGLDIDDIKKIFESLGYGLKQSPNSLSHFGLGLISILQLATSKAFLYTKKKNKKPIFIEIETKELFSKTNEQTNLEELSKWITPILDENKIKEDINEYSKIENTLHNFKEIRNNYEFGSFTEIILLDVDKKVFNIFDNNYEEFNLLRRTLPLPINKKDPFIEKIATENDLQLKFISFFDDNKLCKSLNIYLIDETIDYEDSIEEFDKLYKYFPPFGRLKKINEENLVMDDSQNNFKFYLIAKVDDLFTDEEGDQGKKITGFSIRNQNFLIKENDFFNYDCVRSIHKPLQTWLYGEVFHTNLNNVLQVSRKEFKENHDDFKDFAKKFIEIIKDLNQNLRRAYNYRNKIRKSFIHPLKRVTSGEVFDNINQSLKKSFAKDENHVDKLFEEIFQKLKQRAKKEWFNNENYLLYNILAKEEIHLEYTQDMEIIFTDSLINKENVELKASITGGAKTRLSFSRALFKPLIVNFLNREFKLKFVYLGEKGNEEDEINFNITDTKNEILVNIFNEKVKNFKIDVIEVMIVVNIAYERANNNIDDMKEYILDYLEDEYSTSINYTIVNRLNKYLNMTKAVK